MTTTSGPDAPIADAASPEIDRAVGRVASRRDAWVRLPPRDRAGLLEATIDRVLAAAPAWVDEACVRRGVDPASPTAGEEWLSGPMVLVRHLRQYVAALRAGGSPAPRAVRRVGDRTVVDVFPTNPVDRFLYYFITVEVRLVPGAPATQGRIYRDKRDGRFGPGRTALVLGAGNISSIGPLDVLHQLVVEDRVAVLKMNPVNEYLAPYFERALEPLVSAGYVSIVTGGAAAGDALARDPRIDAIHLTGSDRTFDAIVWGADPDERARRRAGEEPRIDKPFTAELGCITPILVVPGRWSAADIAFQARQVAATVAHNASFNCNAGKVLVVPRGWTDRERFVDAVRAALARTPPRRAYYPGSERRYADLVRRYPASEPVGAGGDGVVPWTLIPDVPARDDEYVLRNEPWCGVLAEVRVDGDGPEEFLDRAVPFVNERVWGTLSCMLLADGRTQRLPGFARAVDALRYGAVAINAWSGIVYGLGEAPWGAFPGHTRQAIGSGVGFVHNTLLLDHPEKCVLRAPFRIWPKPVWFADHRSLRDLGRRLTRFEARRSFADLLRVAAAGLGG